MKPTPSPGRNPTPSGIINPEIEALELKVSPIIQRMREEGMTIAPLPEPSTVRGPRWIEEIGDDHPDQPRFDGGVLVLALVAALSWVAIGGIALAVFL